MEFQCFQSMNESNANFSFFCLIFEWIASKWYCHCFVLCKLYQPSLFCSYMWQAIWYLRYHGFRFLLYWLFNGFWFLNNWLYVEFRAFGGLNCTLKSFISLQILWKWRGIDELKMNWKIEGILRESMVKGILAR